MRLRLLTVALLTALFVPGLVLADSIIQVTPVTTIDLGAEQATGRVPVVSGVALSPTGHQMATAGDDHLVRVWDFQQGNVIHKLMGHGDWVRAVAFSPDGQRLATAGDDRRVRLWDLTSKTPLQHSVPTPKIVAQTLAYSPDGRLLAVGGFGNEVMLIRTSDGQVERTLESPGADVRVLAFSPDGSQLAAAGRHGTIRIWSAGQHVRDLVGHRRRVRALAYSPDGSRLASAGDDREIRLWDTTTGGPLATLPKQPAKLSALTFCSPDFLAYGGSDNNIRVWNLPEACEAFSLEGHTGTVTTLVWNPDTQTLISGSFDTTVRVWSLNLNAMEHVSQKDSENKLGK